MGNDGGRGRLRSLIGQHLNRSASASGNQLVRSQRALGIFALCAVILAAISFAAVDVTIETAVTAGAVAPFTIACALIGTAALIASVPPAIAWFVNAVRHAHHERGPHPVRIGGFHRVYDEGAVEQEGP